MPNLDPSMIVCVQYSAISLVCVFILIYCIIVTNRSAEHSSELLFYKLTMCAAALCAITDILYALREYGTLQLGAPIHYISEILYSLGSISGAFCWFIYSEKKQRSRIGQSNRLIKLCAVPFALMCLFTLTTPIHKLCFSFSGSQYIRGILNVPFTTVCIIFIVYSGITALIHSFRKEYHSRKTFLRYMFIYTLLLAGAQLLQISVGSIIPFRILFATVLFVFITLHGMCETVTIDAVSHINNRFSLNRVLEDRILSKAGFWLTMIDIDEFKQINDRYGHASGDAAIAYTASAITRAVPRHYFVARYGGDEFAVVAPFDEESRIRTLENDIRAELVKVTNENVCPFGIDITAGYAAWSEQINNIPDMIEAADRMLYEKKRAKKLQR